MPTAENYSRPKPVQNDVDDPRKQCRTCGETKTITEFHLLKGMRDGRSSDCKLCRSIYRRQHYLSNRDSVLEKCKEYYVNNKDRFRLNGQKWYGANKDKIRTHRSNYRIQNKDKINASHRDSWHSERKYIELPKRRANRNPVKENVRARDYRARNKEKVDAYRKEYAKNNPEVIKARSHRRRMREKLAGGSFTASEWAATCKKYGLLCLSCGQSKPLEPDHIIPVSRGGNGFITNIQPLCHSCNASKNTKTIDYRPDMSSLLSFAPRGVCKCLPQRTGDTLNFSPTT